MVTSNPGQRCPMVQLYCSEQISIPESFPNILKTYAKAAIRTQPYDILRWSAAYFRCLANNATPPAKIRLERDCRQGSLTKGYLKVLVAQVGKGFFISRCLLQERWKALCLPEDDLLKYLSLCRMLNWPQVHWLKVLAVMIGSLNETPHDTMVMVCELLTDDVEGGLARIPYWMFKICYTFVAKLECSQEQCFVNGQMVLPWGDLEEATPMDSLPRVLSATLLKDTIITTCKAKFDKPYYNIECTCPPETSSSTASTEFMINSHLGNPKELLGKCEDFDTIMLLLQDAQDKPLTEDDFKGPHFISEKQLKKAQEMEDESHKQRQQQCNKTEQNAHECLQQEAFQMLREVGPPWTWLHQFTTNGCNTASYNFIDQEFSISDNTPDVTSVESFNLIKEEPNQGKDQSSTSSFYLSEVERLKENKSSLESFKSIIEEANEQKKCDIEKTSSIVSFLKSEELSVLQRAGEPFKLPLNLKEIVSILQRAERCGISFTDVEQLMEHVRAALLGNMADFPTTTRNEEARRRSSTPDVDNKSLTSGNDNSITVPSEWAETSPKEVVAPPAATWTEKKPESPKEEAKPKDDMTQIFTSTVEGSPEQAAKMPKFCFDTKDEDELILGLVPLSEPTTPRIDEKESSGSILSSTDVHSGEGYRQDSSGILLDEPTTTNYCCVDAPTLKPNLDIAPPEQFHCSFKPLPGIGPAVSQKTIDDFLAFLRLRSRSQRGLINPRNFKEERCPYMVDTTLHLPN